MQAAQTPVRPPVSREQPGDNHPALARECGYVPWMAALDRSGLLVSAPVDLFSLSGCPRRGEYSAARG